RTGVRLGPGARPLPPMDPGNGCSRSSDRRATVRREAQTLLPHEPLAGCGGSHARLLALAHPGSSTNARPDAPTLTDSPALVSGQPVHDRRYCPTVALSTCSAISTSLS